MLLIFTASSFKCYQCSAPHDGEYTKEQCEKDQKEVECNSTEAMPMVCVRLWGEKTDDKKHEYRDCVLKSVCEGKMKKYCSDKKLMEEMKIKECEARCCQSDLCNSAFSTSANMIMMMFAALCGVMLL